MAEHRAVPKTTGRSGRRWLAVGVLTVAGATMIGLGLSRTTTVAAAPLPPAISSAAGSVMARTGATGPSSAATGHASSSTTAGGGPAAAVPKSVDLPAATAGAVAPLPGDGGTPSATSSTAEQNATSTPVANTLSIPAIGQADVPVGAATVTTDGVLEPPANVHSVGLWTPGAPLSATVGTTDITGHVDYTGQGPGALHDIAYLQTGDRIYTTDASGHTTTWSVDAVNARSKADGVDVTAFPGRSGPRTLVLITCGGAFDSADRSYLANVYVTAHPAA